MIKQIPQGYKQTKLGIIPNDWEVVKLGELSQNGIMNGVFNDPKKVGKGLKLINVANLYNEPYINYNDLKLLEVSKKEFEKFSALRGDLFFTRSSLKEEGIAHCNLFNINANDTVFECHTMRIRPKKDVVNSYYLYRYCQSSYARKILISNAKTTTMTTIDQNGLYSLLVPLPPLKEQDKIAEVLSTWDEAITKQEQLIEQKQVFKKGIMQQIFSQKLRFKDDNGNNYPAWKKYKLTKVAKTSIGLVTTMTTNYVENDGTPLIRNSDISPNKIKDNLIQLSNQFANQYSNRKLRYLDIVTVHTGEVGISAVIDKKLDGCHGFATLNTKVDQNIVNPFFLSCYFNSCFYISYAIKMSTGDGRCNFNLKDFDNSIIPTPILEEQNKIVNFLTNIDDEITKQIDVLDQLKLQKQSLMQKLLTGQVRCLV